MPSTTIRYSVKTGGSLGHVFNVRIKRMRVRHGAAKGCGGILSGCDVGLRFPDFSRQSFPVRRPKGSNLGGTEGASLGSGPFEFL